jgi:FkbM family methyltransferase
MRRGDHSRERLRLVLREPDPAPELWKVPRRWLTGPVRARRLGLRLELDLRDNLARTVYFTGTYEPELVRFLSTLHAPEVFADVGAHIGIHSLVAARVGARVVAFEPAPDSAARLRAAAAENGLAVEVVEAALGKEEGEIGLFADPRYDRADAGVRSLAGSGPQVATARATTLDACGLDRLDVLKVDVEGAEAAVLEGARDTLTRLRPRAVIVESKGHGHADRVRSVLLGCGYEPTGGILDGTNEVWGRSERRAGEEGGSPGGGVGTLQISRCVTSGSHSDV